MLILNRPEVLKRIHHAKKHHTSRYEDEEMFCDCVRCYGKEIKYTYAAVKKHRLRYGKSDTEQENYHLPRLLSPAVIRGVRESSQFYSLVSPLVLGSPSFTFYPWGIDICAVSGTLLAVADLRRLLGYFMHSYLRNELLRTPSTIAPCSPGIEPPLNNNDTPWYAPHVIWEMMGSPCLPIGPRSPNLASIDSERAPSIKDEDEEDHWRNLLDEDDPPTKPPFDHDNDVPARDDPPDEPDDAPELEDQPPAFQGVFRDLDADADAEDQPPDDHPCAAFDDEPAEFRNIMIHTYLFTICVLWGYQRVYCRGPNDDAQG
ncbi:hypothetical protein FS749_012988 [Ceratobasidium sp. UAMH 11750]|nr:hypothetical protein FS749_012988 [Ceratobasidium sp. UAMH 11750]